jgi:outer membrane protein assembly factor BamB
LFEVDLPTARTLNGEGVTLSGRVVADALWQDDLLFVGEERNLVAIDTEAETELWQIETGQSVWSKPLIIDDVLYFTSLDHFLYAVDPQTGDIAWQLDLEGAVPETPVFYDGRLYVGGFARKIFEISLDGEILSTFDTENWVWGKPAIVDDILYAADLSGTVYALNIGGDGFEEVWQQKVSERAIRTTPLVSDEYVIVGARDNHVYWLDRQDGSTFFSREVAGEVLSDMLLIEPSETVDIPEPYVIVATLANEEFVVAFRLQNGERAWPNSFTR